MSPSRGDEYANTVQRAAAALMARRRNTQGAAQTPPSGSNDNNVEFMRLELVFVMDQQAAMVTWLEELERERLKLPPPTGETFELIDTTRSRAIVPVTVHAHDSRASNGGR